MAYWRISKLVWKNGLQFVSCDKMLEPQRSRKAKAFCLAILQWITGKPKIIEPHFQFPAGPTNHELVAKAAHDYDDGR